MRWLMSLPEADRPFSMNGAVLELAERLRRMTRLDFPFAPLSSISMWPSSLSFLTKDLRSCARPRTYNVGNGSDRNCQQSATTQSRAHRAETVTYSRREVEAKTDGAGNGTLPRPVGSENHVEIRARAELDPVVGQEVPELYADNRARHEPAQFKDSEPPAAHS